MTKNKNMKDLIETDVTLFLAMCNEEDKKFFTMPKKLHTAEQYARLSCIGVALGMQGLVLAVISDAETTKKFDEYEQYLEKIKRDYRLIVGWIDEFVDGVKNEILKEVAQKMWSEKREKISPENFNISKLL